MKTQPKRDENSGLPRDGMNELVILVHGIWMTGLELAMLSWRLQQDGFVTRRFSYPSLRSSPRENAAALNRFILDQEAGKVHLVAHSLGGIVLMHLFEHYQGLPPGRVVLMGSPVRGSGVAHKLSRNSLTRGLLGRSVKHGLLGDVPEWSGERELGVIAGSSGIGVGNVVGGMVGPGDGTVALEETLIPSATDYCQIPASHTGMVVSTDVAREVIRFLKTGSFSHIWK